MHWHLVYADDGLCRVAGRIPSLPPQMRRRSTLEEFHPECTGTSMRVFLLQRLRERDGGLVATRSRASPPTVERLTVELEKGEPPTFFWKQKLPTFTWQLKEDEKLKGAVARASIARTDFTRSTAYYCLLFPLFRPSRASAADSLAPFGASWRAQLAFWFVHNTHRVHLPRVTGTLKASWLLYFPAMTRCTCPSQV
jgi:hypothetical protein